MKKVTIKQVCEIATTFQTITVNSKYEKWHFHFLVTHAVLLRFTAQKLTKIDAIK